MSWFPGFVCIYCINIYFTCCIKLLICCVYILRVSSQLAEMTPLLHLSVFSNHHLYATFHQWCDDPPTE